MTADVQDRDRTAVLAKLSVLDRFLPVWILTAMAGGLLLGRLISEQTPKLLTTDAVQASDVVITMGCGDTCPVFPGKRYLDWDLPDPAGKGVEAVRPIRDEIRSRVEALLTELQPARG